MMVRASDPWETLIYGKVVTDEYDNILCVDGLIDIAKDKYADDLPDLELIGNIIALAGRDRDEAFFASVIFKAYCAALHLKPNYVLKLVKEIWKNDDNK